MDGDASEVDSMSAKVFKFLVVTFEVGAHMVVEICWVGMPVLEVLLREIAKSGAEAWSVN